MKTRSILFSAEMVRAILDGRKTMTRRAVKFPKDFSGEVYDNSPFGLKYSSSIMGGTVQRLSCPYGEIGDRLYVRETHYRFGHWERNGQTKIGNEKWKFVAYSSNLHYEDNKPGLYWISMDKSAPGIYQWYKRNARFMPKSAARIWLEITGVRVERLQDISEEDAIREGVEFNHDLFGYKNYYKYPDFDAFGGKFAATRSFRSLWRSLHGPESWELNPFVWVVEFKRVQP